MTLVRLMGHVLTTNRRNTVLALGLNELTTLKGTRVEQAALGWRWQLLSLGLTGICEQQQNCPRDWAALCAVLFCRIAGVCCKPTHAVRLNKHKFDSHLVLICLTCTTAQPSRCWKHRPQDQAHTKAEALQANAAVPNQNK